MMQRYPIRHILMADDDRDHAILFERNTKDNYPYLTVSCVQEGNS